MSLRLITMQSDFLPVMWTSATVSLIFFFPLSGNLPQPTSLERGWLYTQYYLSHVCSIGTHQLQGLNKCLWICMWPKLDPGESSQGRMERGSISLRKSRRRKKRVANDYLSHYIWIENMVEKKGDGKTCLRKGQREKKRVSSDHLLSFLHHALLLRQFHIGIFSDLS